MKGIHLIKLIFILAMVWGCESEDLEYAGSRYDDMLPNNELVFEITANVTPMSSHIALKDTLWLSIHIDDSVLTDKISEQEITLPLAESRFIIQIEVNDLIDNRSAGVEIIERNGTLVDIKDGIVTANFGHPDTIPYLDLGFVFEDVGRYALVLHNYPNPFLDNAEDACEDKDECNDVWYDLLFYKNPYSAELMYQAFVEYRFDIGELTTIESQLNKYLDVSTYSNSIYPVTVR